MQPNSRIHFLHRVRGEYELFYAVSVLKEISNNVFKIFQLLGLIMKSRTRPGPRNFQYLGPDQDRQKFQNLSSDRTRTEINFKTWDRTGPGPRQISKYRTGPNQDQQNFENLGPIRTGQSPDLAVR